LRQKTTIGVVGRAVRKNFVSVAGSKLPAQRQWGQDTV
jgi:hypothetical protein